MIFNNSLNYKDTFFNLSRIESFCKRTNREHYYTPDVKWGVYIKFAENSYSTIFFATEEERDEAYENVISFFKMKNN
jgi:hypothetical protein